MGIRGEGRFDAEPTSGVFIMELNGLFDGEIVAGLFLFEQSHTVDLLDKEAAATIEDGEFRTIDLNEAVVDATGKKGSHGVLNGGDTDIGIIGMGNHRATGCIDNIFCQSRYDGLSRQVNTLHLQTMTGRSGKESSSQFETCMETLAAEGKGS